jgi:hypothetical protein
LQVANLPFANANLNIWAVSIGFASNVATAASTTMGAYVIQAASNIAITATPIGGGAATNIAYDAAGSFVISGSYAAT